MAWNDKQKQTWKEIPIGGFFLDREEAGFIPLSAPCPGAILKIKDFRGTLNADTAVILTGMLDKVKALAAFGAAHQVMVSVDDAAMLARVREQIAAGKIKL